MQEIRLAPELPPSPAPGGAYCVRPDPVFLFGSKDKEEGRRVTYTPWTYGSTTARMSWKVDKDVAPRLTPIHRLYYSTGWGKIKHPNTKIAISQKCLDIFAPNFALLFGTILCTNALLCAVFTWHTSHWRKRKLQEQILQLNTSPVTLVNYTVKLGSIHCRNLVLDTKQLLQNFRKRVERVGLLSESNV